MSETHFLFLQFNRATQDEIFSHERFFFFHPLTCTNRKCEAIIGKQAIILSFFPPNSSTSSSDCSSPPYHSATLKDRHFTLGRFLYPLGKDHGKDTWELHNTYDLIVLRAILQEREAELEMKNFKPPSIFVWR